MPRVWCSQFGLRLSTLATMLVSMSTLSWALLLLCLPEVGLGKNIGPRPRHASLPSTREGRPGITVPSDHEFFANYAKNFSWFDEDEHRNLLGLPSLPSLPRTSLKDTIGIGPAGLQKRINTVVGIAPDNCLACADGGVGLEEADVSWLTTPYLQAQMLKTPADLQNNCLFYSAIFKPADYALWLTKYPPFPAGVDPALSEFATTYACSSYMVTIWASSQRTNSAAADLVSIANTSHLDALARQVANGRIP